MSVTQKRGGRPSDFDEPASSEQRCKQQLELHTEVRENKVRQGDGWSFAGDDEKERRRHNWDDKGEQGKFKVKACAQRLKEATMVLMAASWRPMATRAMPATYKCGGSIDAHGKVGKNH